MKFADPPEPLTTDPALNLARDPFAPELVSPQGATVRFLFNESKPLNPPIYAGHLKFYLNLYVWHDGGKVGPIDANGRLSALQRADPDRAMVLLVSGLGGCGRSSMINLLLYEIEQDKQHPPIVVRYDMPITASRAQHATNIAALLEKRVENSKAGGEAFAQKLEKTRVKWLANIVPGGTPDPNNLFRLLKEDMPEGPSVIVILDAVSHKLWSDIWRPICEMLSPFADFVIVTLSENVEAKLVGKDLEGGNAQFGWIEAPKIKQDKMAELLAVRLARERATPGGDPTSLVPFTDEALQVLFSPSGGAKSAPEWPIKFAMAKLAGAFAAKSQELAQVVASGKRPSAAEIFITGKDMETYLARR